MATRKPERVSPLSKDAVRAASYSYRPPSPPFIHVPILQQRGRDALQRQTLQQQQQYYELEFARGPAEADQPFANPARPACRELALITRTATTHAATDRAASWAYELCRQAQPILDFLYLGPTSVVRDVDFLRREAISMVLVARDARMAATRLLSVDRAAAALGVVAAYIDIDAPHGMVRAFPDAVRAINDHLLAVHRQGQADAPDVPDAPDAPDAHAAQHRARRARVLVTCESGNDRSAAIVAAYIMAMYGKSMIPTIQFISIQRFRCSFDEEVKRTLQTWEDILRARHAVALDRQPGVEPPARAKRALDDMMDVDHDADLYRFTDRHAFAPFHDAGADGPACT